MRSIIYPYAPGAAECGTSENLTSGYPAFLAPLLPKRARDAIRAAYEGGRFSVIEEIRLRREVTSSLTTDRGTVLLPLLLLGREMDETLTRISGGSLYAHSETIGEGYLILNGGVRVGICGRAAVENGKVIGVYDPSALSFRIPGTVRIDTETVERLVHDGARNGSGVLIYAPPGVGKTTLLRALIRRLGGGGSPYRIAVVDSRGELALSPAEKERKCGCTVDFLSGYPRPIGIEIAVRALNAELVVCDEIGGVEEARSVLAVQNAGIPLLATAHGRDIGGLLRRAGIRMMHDGNVFGYYVGITRSDGGFSYTVTEREDADAVS